MDKDRPINYTQEAFLHPVNMGVFLIATILGVVLSSLGLFPIELLSFIFALELIYLGIIPQLPRFRRVIKARAMSQRRGQIDERDIFESLDREAKKKFLTLKHLVTLIKENFDKLPYGSQGMLDHLRKKMNTLTSNYLSLLDLHSRYENYINASVHQQLQKEVEEEARKIDGLDSERLKKIKQRRLNILNKRLKKYTIAKEKFLICQSHLQTIEDAMQYIYEQSMTINKPEEIGSQLDSLLEEVEETSVLIDELDDGIFPVEGGPAESTLDDELKKAQMEREQENIHQGAQQVKE